MLENLLTGTKPVKNEMTDEALASHCLNAKTYTEDTILTTTQSWQVAWNEYRNRADFSGKLPWQSQINLPKFSQAVRITKNMMKQTMSKASKFFELSGSTDAAREVELAVTEAVIKVAEQSQFRQRAFPKGVFRGLLENLIIWKTWVEEIGDTPKMHPDQMYKFPISVVSAFDLYIDPTGRRKFVIHKIRMDFSDFKRLVERGVYRKEALEAVTAQFRDEKETWRKARESQQDAPQPNWRKEVELLEYWGDVDDENGQTIHRNCTYTVVNQRWIARAPMPNPFWHKRAPFVWGPIFDVDGSEYGEGFGDHVIAIAKMFNETMNVTLDANMAASVKAYEIDMNYVRNPSSLKSGIYPGKTIQVYGVPPGHQAVREFSLGTVNPSSLTILASLDREFQNSTGVNEFIAALVGTGDKTATEVRSKTAQSVSFMQSVSEDIEDNCVAPTIKMLYSNILQYNPEILGTAANQVPSEDLKFNFNVKGMSEIMAQENDLAKLIQWVGMIAKTPAGQQIDWNRVAEMSARWAGQDPKKLLLSEATASVDQNQNKSPVEAAKAQGMLQILKQQGGA